ncbi:hypothetical protein [Scytonema sp. NUACC21]
MQRRRGYVTTFNEEKGFANAVERIILGNNGSQPALDQNSR